MMRKPDAAPVAAKKAALPACRQGDEPAQIVCLALALAVLALALRISSIW